MSSRITASRPFTTMLKSTYGALGQLDAWLDGRRLDDAALAAYLAEFHDAGRAALSAATAVAAARFRARLAGQADPAGARTARVLAGDRGRGQACPFRAAADQAAVARGRLAGMIAGLLFMGGNGDRKSPPDLGRIWMTPVTACWSLSAAARRTRTARRTTHGSCRTASRERPARCGPPQDRMLRSEPLAQQLDSFIVGATYRRINVSQIRTFWGCWPPVDEQLVATDYLDRETAILDAMVTKVETVIERLQEYRTALITAAVTGKIDVRGAVPHEEDAA